METELAKLDGLDIMHEREDTLLHLSGVFGSEDDHLHPLEVDLDGRGRGHSGREAVGWELAGVVDCEVGLSIGLELSLGGSDEHVVLQERRGKKEGGVSSDATTRRIGDDRGQTMKRAW